MKNISHTILNGLLKVCLLVSFGALFVLASFELYNAASGSGQWIGRLSQKWAVTLLFSETFFLLLFGLIAGVLWRPEKLIVIRDSAITFRERLWFFRWIIVLLLITLFTWFYLFSPWGFIFRGPYFRLVSFLLAIVICAYLVTEGEKTVLDWSMIIAVTVMLGAVFAFGKLLTEVTDYPFSLYWSEGNRMWDYSIPYGESIYTYSADPRRYLLTGIGFRTLFGFPFLFSRPSIEVFRLWNAILFSFPYAFLGWSLIRRLGNRMWVWFFFGLWLFLFLNQGPIWTPLVFAAILVAYGRSGPIWLKAAWVLLAGAYAGFARFTWSFAPALWAVMLTIGQPTRDRTLKEKSHWKHAALLFAAGMAGAFLQQDYSNVIAASQGQSAAGANPVQQPLFQLSGYFSYALRLMSYHELLWERLLPNATYGPGVLMGLMIAIFPLTVLLTILMKRGVYKIRIWQAATILSILFIFITAGLAASVKVGGGTNLHNLDTALMGLALLSGLIFDKLSLEELKRLVSDKLVGFVFFLAAAVPAFLPVIGSVPLQLPPQEKTDTALTVIRNYVDCAKEHGDVLFMDQRQLLTFGFVQDVVLTPEFEKKLVMDKALAADEDFFNTFYEDLRSKRFSLIILEPQETFHKDDSQSLAYEHNAWVTWVTMPLYEYYDSVERFEPVKVEMFMPKERGFECN